MVTTSVEILEALDQEFLLRQTRIMCTSYAHWTGRQLVAAADGNAAESVRQLWTAPFAVVAHDTQADPMFNYGNVCAQQLFGMGWREFTRLPSRLSAEPLAREERARLLARVTQHGYVDDYAGVRIAKNGTRFMIRNATVWNLMDQDGRYCGQAARFDPPLPSDILENV